MKKVVALFAILLLGTGAGFASGNPDLLKEIKRKIAVDLSKVQLDASGQDYVTASFRIVDGAIKIMEINGTSDDLEAAMIRELNRIHIESPYVEGKTYVYRFTFEII